MGSLVGYSPWGRKRLDTTERLHHHHPPPLLNSIYSNNFLVEILGFSLSSIMSAMTVLLLLFFFLIWIPFLSHVWLLWLRLPVLCKIEVVTVCILLHDLRRRNFNFLHWVYYLCHEIPLLYWDVLFLSTLIRVLIMNGCWINWMPFLHLLR